ncbi:hypothetical protein CFO_g3385 [Ceratocystis platani]|uniref:Myb-like domain-containing protein n=1 Tax=Ceratocystis fimbriata f. sp. platani TaxID=88771 RepID=A0A0F8CU86_CERFI|nr:hypothetical protein CFO_g3385 [Ceratocystis platani]
MAGRTRSMRGHVIKVDPSDEQAAATAVMALSEKKNAFRPSDESVIEAEAEAEGEEDLEDDEDMDDDAEAEGEDDDAEADEAEENAGEEDDDAEVDVDTSGLPEMAIDQQLSQVVPPMSSSRRTATADENTSIATDLQNLNGQAAFVQSTAVPNPADILPSVDAIPRPMGSSNGKDPAVLGLLLPALRSDALSLKNHLAQPCPNSPSWSQVWNILRQAFDLIKGPYMTPGDALLNLNEIQNSFEDNATAETAYLSMSLANLATVLDALNRHEEADDDLKILLQILDTGFPFSIVHSTGISVDWLDANDYIGMALDIRTQRWMLELHGSDKFEAVNIFKKIFLDESEDPSRDWDGDRQKLPGANWKDIGDFDMTEFTNDENDEMIRQKTMQRVDAVFEFAESQNDPDGTLNKFSEVQPFVQELRRFIVKIFEEVDRAYLAKTRQKLPDGGEEYDDGMSSTQRSGFNEPSRNLYDGLSSLSRFSRLGSSDYARNRKRRVPENDIDQEAAIRKVPQKRQRRSMATPSSQLAQLQAVAAASTAPQQTGHPIAPSSIVSGVSGVNGTSMPPPTASSVVPHSPSSSIMTSQGVAVDGTSGKRKELQKRFFWGPSDTEKLCDYIDRYGCNWARISKEATFEIPRTQQQLRDKARNLKVDMLRHDKILLPGFDNVGLHLKEQTLVRKHSKNPHRTEKDVDEHNIPINTEWEDGMDEEYDGSTVGAAMSVAGTQVDTTMDTASVTDPSLSQATASIANMSVAIADPSHPVNNPSHPARAAAQQELHAQLQQTPEEIHARIQERFGQMHQAAQLSFAQAQAQQQHNENEVAVAAAAAAAAVAAAAANQVDVDVDMNGGAQQQQDMQMVPVSDTGNMM